MESFLSYFPWLFIFVWVYGSSYLGLETNCCLDWLHSLSLMGTGSNGILWALIPLCYNEITVERRGLSRRHRNGGCCLWPCTCQSRVFSVGGNGKYCGTEWVYGRWACKGDWNQGDHFNQKTFVEFQNQKCQSEDTNFFARTKLKSNSSKFLLKILLKGHCL